MSQLHLDHASALDFLDFLGFRERSGPGRVQALFLQGCRPLGESPLPEALLRETPNEPDHYNDAALLVGHDERGAPLLRPYLATMDAGNAYRRADGLPHLAFGHPHRFVPGPHYATGRPVFRPKRGINRYWRDADADGWPGGGEGVQLGNGTILIHAMGGLRVQRWSAGCLGIWSPEDYSGEEWIEFRDAGYAHCARAGTLSAVLWPFADLLAWSRQRAGHLPTLFPGATGRWARAVQEALNRQGAQLRVDGDWRAKTTAAVQELQRRHGLEATGVVDGALWALLRRSAA